MTKNNRLDKLNMWEALNQETARKLYDTIWSDEYNNTLDGDWAYEEGENYDAIAFNLLSPSQKGAYSSKVATIYADSVMKETYNEFERNYGDAYLEMEELEQNLVDEDRLGVVKDILSKLGLYVFLEEGENGNYLGICTDINSDADVYIHENGDTEYMNNVDEEANIKAVYGNNVLLAIRLVAEGYKKEVK